MPNEINIPEGIAATINATYPKDEQFAERFAAIFGYSLSQSQPVSLSVDDAAKEYFEIYTGGNDYVATWTKKAIIEFAIDFYNRQASQPAFIIKKIDTNKHFWCKCENCGWEDSSEFCEGCHPIADTGDHTDPLCPVCFNNKLDGNAVIDVPEYAGVVEIKIPIDLVISPYKKELARLQSENEKKRWDIPASQPVSTNDQPIQDEINWKKVNEELERTGRIIISKMAYDSLIKK